MIIHICILTHQRYHQTPSRTLYKTHVCKDTHLWDINTSTCKLILIHLINIHDTRWIKHLSLQQFTLRQMIPEAKSKMRSFCSSCLMDTDCSDRQTSGRDVKAWTNTPWHWDYTQFFSQWASWHTGRHPAHNQKSSRSCVRRLAACLAAITQTCTETTRSYSEGAHKTCRHSVFTSHVTK